MPTQGVQRKLAAILCADVEGYSRLMQDDPEDTLHTLTGHREVFRRHTETSNGRVVDSPGDNILIEFSSAIEAVQCAVEIQRELAEKNAELAANRQMRFRIGIDLGDLLKKDDALYGDGVNISARLQTLAKSGGICISERVYGQVVKRLPIEFEFLGKRSVKNIADPIRVYRVLIQPGDKARRSVRTRPQFSVKWPKISLAIAVVLLMISGAKLIWQQFGDTQGSGEAVPSIAVLPLKFQSDQIAPLFGSLTDELSRYLQNSGAVRLASADAIAAIPSGSTPAEIASRLGVRYVFSGALSLVDKSLKILISVFDSKTGKLVFSEDLDNADQQETMVTVSNKVLTGIDADRTIESQPLTDPKAYELYLKARRHAASTFLSDEAEALYREAIGIDPRFAQAYAGLCTLQVSRYLWTRSTQNFETAEQNCIRAWTIDDRNLEVQMALASLYYASGQLEKCREMLGKILDANSYHYEAQVSLAECYLDETPDLAEAQLKRLISQNPGSPDAYTSLQYLYWKQGRYEEAIEQQKYAVALVPNNEGAKLLLSADLLGAGKLGEAKELLVEMLESDTEKTGDIQNNLGFVLFYEGDYEEAARLFKIGIEREPEEPINYRNLGDAIWHLEGKEAAVPIFEKVVDLARRQIEINPNDSSMIQNMVAAFGSLGEVEEFLKAKETLIELAPDNPQTYYNIAVAESRLGQMQLAREHAEKARETGFPVALLRADPDIRASGMFTD